MDDHAPMRLRERLRALPVLTAQSPALPRADQLPTDPRQLFLEWLDTAIEAGVSEPHAMTLSTADAHSRPNSRVLILKDVDDRGWWFATDTLSAKVAELAGNPMVALSFYWPGVGRQVRIQGTAEPADAATSAADFSSRGARARATVLAARDLERRGGPWTRAELVAATDERERELTTGLGADPYAVHALSQGQQPPPWVAYVVVPEWIEFWQADPGRLHHRVSYCRSAAGGWSTTKLPH